MIAPPTKREARILELLRGVLFGEVRVFKQGGKIVRVEHVQSEKFEGDD